MSKNLRRKLQLVATDAHLSLSETRLVKKIVDRLLLVNREARFDDRLSNEIPFRAVLASSTDGAFTHSGICDVFGPPSVTCGALVGARTVFVCGAAGHGTAGDG